MYYVICMLYVKKLCAVYSTVHTKGREEILNNVERMGVVREGPGDTVHIWLIA
jgi:hypothetical protein